jgi:hypothetical protein
MMRWVIFCVAVVVIAGIATIASTYLASTAPIEAIPTAQDVPSGPPGDAEVDHPLLHEFGFMAQQTDGKQEWTITNKGTGEILLEKGESTCSCTIANLENGRTATLPPGKSTKVTLNWNTKGNDGKFNQKATVLVRNDPKKQKLDFQVAGTVLPPVLTMPNETAIHYLEGPNDKPHVREMVVFSIDRPDLKLTGVTASNPAMLDVAIKPLKDDELKKLQDLIPRKPKVDIQKASQIVVTLKPGASIGAFSEEVVVSTDHPKKPKLSVMVDGRLSGPITVTPDRIRLLNVASKQGESQSLTLWVRDRAETKFTIEKKPKNFDVEISPMGTTGDGKAAKYQLTIKVPPGTPAGTIADELIIKTDHPHAGELKIPLTVLVRAS